MAVLVEMISVVIRKESIEQKISLNKYLNLMEYIVNHPSCMDDDLLCIHMNSPVMTSEFVDFSQQCNLNWGKDFIIVDQNDGPTTECDWIQFGRVGRNLFKTFEDDMGIAICSFYDGPKNFGSGFYLFDIDNFQVFFPREWKYEGSMSQGHNTVKGYTFLILLED